MTRQFTYGRQERLKSRKLIEQLFKEGRSFAMPPFRVYWLLQQRPDPGTPAASAAGAAPAGPLAAGSGLQCGVGVSSRQFKKAVDRNRVKRLAREAWRVQKKPLADAMAARPEQLALFFIYTGKELPVFGTVKEKMAAAINKLATMLNNEKGPLHT